MKLHDLRPAPGSKTERTRVGRGIAAGKGKTAGRGTKGQKARSGVAIPAWFEGGQTPIHMRVPKLRGFKARGRIDYEVVNVGDLSRAAEAGRFEGHGEDGEEGTKPSGGRARKTATSAPITVNADTMAQAGLVRRLRHPVKVLGDGDVSRALFVVADAFTRSAREKIEAAGGTAQLLEVPDRPMPALGVKGAGKNAKPTEAKATEADEGAAEAPEADDVAAAEAPEADDAEPAQAAAPETDEPAEAGATTPDTDERATAEAPARKRPRRSAARDDSGTEG